MYLNKNEKLLTIFCADNTLERIRKWILQSPNLILFSLILEHNFDKQKEKKNTSCAVYNLQMKF